MTSDNVSAIKLQLTGLQCLSGVQPLSHLSMQRNARRADEEAPSSSELAATRDLGGGHIARDAYRGAKRTSYPLAGITIGN
jgi:hypothetical protein